MGVLRVFFGGVIIAAKLGDFLCDLSKALTDKTQVCGWAHVTRLRSAKHVIKTLSDCSV